MVSDGKIGYKKLKPFQCLVCSGSGRVYDPDDPPCPIEGNKCRRIIACSACGKSGEGKESEWRRWYKDWKEDKAKASREERLKKTTMAGIKRKLTKKEQQFLGILKDC
jgi:hypothetical protein